jgi:hypothetical protein
MGADQFLLEWYMLVQVIEGIDMVRHITFRAAFISL